VSTSIASSAFQYVDRAIAAAPVRTVPWEHIVAENVFAPDAYGEIEATFPRDLAVYHRQWKIDPALYHGTHDRRLEAFLPRDAELLTDAQRTFWTPLVEHLSGARFIRGLIERFRPPLAARFGTDLDAPDFVERRLDVRFMFALHEPNYALGVHTDIAWKVLTLIFYVPDRGDDESLGTALYVPRDPNLVSDGSRHLDPALFRHVATVPFRANSALIFARGDHTFHGVEPCTAEALGGSLRPGFHVNIVERRPAAR